MKRHSINNAKKPSLRAAGVAHHLTQRGVNREDVFYSHRDRETYLTLVQDQREDAGVRILGWCLMTNHVHWVVVPEREVCAIPERWTATDRTPMAGPLFLLPGGG